MDILLLEKCPADVLGVRCGIVVLKIYLKREHYSTPLTTSGGVRESN